MKPSPGFIISLTKKLNKDNCFHLPQTLKSVCGFFISYIYIINKKNKALNNDIIIQVRGLSKTVDGMPVLSDFSMEVFDGDFCGIIGPNNAGKTMLLRVLATLAQPDKGKIEIFGKRLIADRQQILKDMGVMVGNPVFYEHLTVFDNLAMYAVYSGFEKDNEEINRILQVTGLQETSDIKVKNLSAGDRKKLGIALAVYNYPSLVILDDPFTGLDIKSVVKMKELFKSLNSERGTTFIIASKQLNNLEGLISRMILMEDGQLIAEGKVDDLLGKSKIGLILETDNNEEAVKLLNKNQLPINDAVIKGGVIRLSCEREAIPYINKFLFVSDIQVYMLRPENAIASYYLTFTK